MFLVRAITSGKASFLFIAMALGLAIPPSLFADSPPATIFGNYAGAGKCPSQDSPESCSDTGVTDNLFVKRNEKKDDPDTDNADAYVTIRRLFGNGRSCTLGRYMIWAGDHLAYVDKPHEPKPCRLQLWLKDGAVVLKDAGNVCSEIYCRGRGPLEGAHFKKGPDQLLAAYKKSAIPPPAAIYGRYSGAGDCPPYDPKAENCFDTSSTDRIDIKPSKDADARVNIRMIFDVGHTCNLDEDMFWSGDHLLFAKEHIDHPGEPYLLQLWFKDGTLTMKDIGGRTRRTYCGTRGTLDGGHFRKAGQQPRSDSNR